MRLKSGVEAPDFEAGTLANETLRLSDYRGRKLWLGFYRYATCPLCNLRINDTIRRLDGLKACGLEIVAVFQSPVENVARHVGRQAPPFPLVCDPEEKLYALYGVGRSLAGFLSPANGVRFLRAFRRGFGPGWMDGTKTRIPADFLIDSEGKIHTAYYGKVIADHIPFEDVEAFASA